MISAKIFFRRPGLSLTTQITSMYSNVQTRSLQDATTALLKQKSTEKKDLQKLRDVLRFHEYRYYIMNDPLIADGEYDQLYKQLQAIEAASPDLITPDSPTQRVAKGLTDDFPKVAHLVPMLSLENSYNADDLRDWDRKVREL